MSEFDAYADTYGDDVNGSISFIGTDADHFAHRKADLLIDLATRLIGDPQGITALDVGCGVGVTDAHLIGRIGSLHGVDVSHDAIAVATGTHPEVHYSGYDGKRLPFDDASVDLAFAICVAHHVEPCDRPAFIAEMARVVRPGGVVAVFEHNPFNPLTRVAVSRCDFDEGVVLLRRSESTRLLRNAHLEVIEQRYIIFTPFDRPLVHRLEARLGALPIGAQHYVVARR